LSAVSALRVGGLVPFSAVDWPGKLAAVVFLQGCPWRCGYCHNPHLQRGESDDGARAASFDAWLATRAGLLDAVVFSGGEPTAHAALPEALADVRARGFAVGLHTAGAYPRRLERALEHADWVGVDVKAPSRDYASVTRVPGSGAVALASLRSVIASGVDHEVRTTVHPGLLDASALLRLADELASLGVRRWVIQTFRAQGCADAALVAQAPRGARVDAALVARLADRVPALEVRS
jgi:anaerobic ribonucleoside-triphosphate reductase activating protein